jgi:hypothetical protein
MPSFRMGGAICFDPQELAKWLRARYTVPTRRSGKKPVRQVRDVTGAGYTGQSSNVA